tara:strand:- start:1270 stop:2304 length:1035 start_codon:yes stop_codon:yes gene_type:complete
MLITFKSKLLLAGTAIFILLNSALRAQQIFKQDLLFSNKKPLKIKLNYSNKNLNKNTNDSTFIKSKLIFFEKKINKEIQVSLRARGNFRRKHCYFTPVKIKIKKSDALNTIFSDNRTLKLVLPCKNNRDKNDNILKEFIAYKIYEIISLYYFKTRRLEVDYTNQKNKKGINYNLVGFLIEDDDKVAKRFDGKIVKRKISPLAMDDFNSVNLSFFNFLIGNTDFSSAHQHNGKLLFYEKKIIPIPYDFDLTGWVKPKYGLGITNRLGYSFEERNYIGFKRGKNIYSKVRNHYLRLKEKIFNTVELYESEFEYKKSYNLMMDYLMGFYEILEDDKLYDNLIISEAK